MIICISIIGLIGICRAAPINGIYLDGSYLAQKRSQQEIALTIERIVAAGVRDVYLQVENLNSPEFTGKAQRLIADFKANPSFRLLPFLGRRVCTDGKPGACFDLSSATDTTRLKEQVKHLWDTGFDGVQLDLEPVRSGDARFLQLLTKLQQTKPPGKTLSVAGYMLEPDIRIRNEIEVRPKDVNVPLVWDRSYYTQVMGHSDVVVIMNYDTAITSADHYRRWTQYQIESLLGLQQETGCQLQLGIPAYRVGRKGLHDPHVENASVAFGALHELINRRPERFGVTVYVENEMSPRDWKLFQDFAVVSAAKNNLRRPLR